MGDPDAGGSQNAGEHDGGSDYERSVIPHKLQQQEADSRSQRLGYYLAQGKIADPGSKFFRRQCVRGQGQGAGNGKCQTCSLNEPEQDQQGNGAGEAVTDLCDHEYAHGEHQNIFFIIGVNCRTGNQFENECGYREDTGDQAGYGGG